MKVFSARKRIAVDSTIELENLSGKPVDKIVFELNPSLHIEKISFKNNDNPLRFKRIYTIVEIELDKPIEIEGQRNLSIHYQGELDQHYQDYIVLKKELEGSGDWAEDYTYPIYSEFIKRNFAFLPKFLHWYPTFEGLSENDAEKEREKNFFTAILTVIVPEKLTALAPGQLINNSTDKRKRSFIWQTDRKISEMLVVIGSLEIYSKEIDNKKLNICYYPYHKANFENVKNAIDTITRFLAEYNFSPFSSFTIIEIPEIFYDEEYIKTIKTPGIILLSERRFYPIGISKSFRYVGVYLENFNKSVLKEFEPSFVTQLYNATGRGRVFLELSMNQYLEDLFAYSISSNPAKFMHSTVPSGGEARNLYQNTNLLDIYERPKHQFDKVPETIIEGKGPKVLHTLRFLLGEEAFWKSMKAFFHKYLYCSPSLEDFERTIIKVSGKDLDWFFSQYLRGTVLPKYEITEAVALKQESEYQLQIKISNIGSGDMLLPVVIETLGDKVSKEIWIEDKGSVTIELMTNDEPVKVLIDPEHKIYRQQNPGFGDVREVKIFK